MNAPVMQALLQRAFPGQMPNMQTGGGLPPMQAPMPNAQMGGGMRPMPMFPSAQTGGGMAPQPYNTGIVPPGMGQPPMMGGGFPPMQQPGPFPQAHTGGPFQRRFPHFFGRLHPGGI